MAGAGRDVVEEAPSRPRTPSAASVPDVIVAAVPDVDPTEKWVRAQWRNKLSFRQGDIIFDDRGSQVVAARDGKLAGTRLEDWCQVTGGWSATIVGPIGTYESDHFAAAKGRIVPAFSAKKSMVTIMADAEDENRSVVMVRRAAR